MFSPTLKSDARSSRPMLRGLLPPCVKKNSFCPTLDELLLFVFTHHNKIIYHSAFTALYNSGFYGHNSDKL